MLALELLNIEQAINGAFKTKEGGNYADNVKLDRETTEKLELLYNSYKNIFPEKAKKRHRKHFRFSHWFCWAEALVEAGKLKQARESFKTAQYFSQTEWEKSKTEAIVKSIANK